MSEISRSEYRAAALLGAIVLVVTATTVFWLANSGALLAGDGASILIALGRLAGLALMLLMLAQLLLASRAPFLDLFDRFIPLRTHRIIGFSILAVLALHIAFLIAGYALGSGISWTAQFVSFISSWEDVGKALVGAVIILLVGALSAQAVRRHVRYETWYLFHLSLYAAILLSVGHQLASGDMATGAARLLWLALIGGSVAVFFAYRVMRPLWFFYRCRFRVARVVRETPSTVSVYVTGRHLDEFRFDAGQYAHVTFFQRGLASHHPFSFSKPYDGSEIRFTMRAFGDFTNSASDLRVGTRVLIDGPMGHLTRRSAVTGRYCFIAGGVGITPIAALVLALPDPQAAIVLVSNRTREDAPLLGEIRGTGVTLYEYFSADSAPTRINGDEILRTCPDVHTRDVYLCGPSGMLDALSHTLIARGVPRAQIHSEPFAY